MNKFTLFIVFLAICTKSIGQTEESALSNSEQNQINDALNTHKVSSPNMVSFQKVNHIPTNEYTGRAELNIPLYVVKSGDISIPISLSYNSSGVKVDDTPSSVGCNWSLSAGGNVSKIVKGKEDFYYYTDINPFATPNYHRLSSLGWFYLNEFKNNPDLELTSLLGETLLFPLPDKQLISEGINSNIIGIDPEITREDDKEPDLFIASAPGLFSRFVHKKDRTPFEINKIGNKIETSFGMTDLIDFYSFNVESETLNDEWGGLRKINCIDNIKITSPSGMKYTFSELDVSQKASVNPGSQHSPYSRRSKHIQYSYDQVDAYHLSKINSSLTQKEVIFEYEKYSMINEIEDGSWVYFIAGSELDKRPSPLSFQVDREKFPQLNRIKKIVSDTGIVEFVYSTSPRQDLPGDNELSLIRIKDKNNKVIKTITFEYDYIISGTDCDDSKCKRLSLQKIHFFGKNGKEYPGYEFTYNENKLPERKAYTKDFFGYSNSQMGFTTINVEVPILHYSLNKGNLSLFPIPLGDDYVELPGDHSLAPDLESAKAGILTKIKYPTGAITEFTYEFNSFILNDKEVEGAGLRIKSQIIIDPDRSEQILDYFYTDKDGHTSGRLNSFPYYGKIKVGRAVTDLDISKIYFNIYQNSRAQTELTDGGFVGYSRVLSKNRYSDDYTENIYSNSEDFPNTEATIYKLGHPDLVEFDLLSIFLPINFARAQFYYKNGGFGDLTVNNGIYRGKLLKKNIYNSDENKLLMKEIGYTDEIFDTFPLLRIVQESDFDQTSGPKFMFDYYQKNDYLSRRYLKTSEKTTQFFINENVESITESETQFHPDFQIVKEQRTTNSNGEEVNSKLYYPDEVNELVNLTSEAKIAIDKLTANNIFVAPLQTETYVNDVLLNSKRTNYKDWGNDFILPSSIETSKGSQPYEERVIYNSYYPNGNLQEISKKNGLHVVYIWGYNKTVPIAEIQNSTYSQVENAVNLTTIQSLSDADIDNCQEANCTEQKLRVALENLRTYLPDALVTTYTYDPLIGLTSTIDINGNIQFFEYDSFNRLSTIRDNNNKILKNYCYNYKNQLIKDCLTSVTDEDIDNSTPSISIGNYKNYMIPIPATGSVNRYTWDEIETKLESLHPIIYFSGFFGIHPEDADDVLYYDLSGQDHNLPYPMSYYSPHFRAYRNGYSFKMNGLNSLNVNENTVFYWTLEVNGKRIPLPKIQELTDVFFIPECYHNLEGKIYCEIYIDGNVAIDGLLLEPRDPEPPTYIFSSETFLLKKGLEEFDNNSSFCNNNGGGIDVCDPRKDGAIGEPELGG